jgi:hypothetical protein
MLIIADSLCAADVPSHAGIDVETATGVDAKVPSADGID